jgi:hypothetical protein
MVQIDFARELRAVALAPVDANVPVDATANVNLNATANVPVNVNASAHVPVTATGSAHVPVNATGTVQERAVTFEPGSFQAHMWPGANQVLPDAVRNEFDMRSTNHLHLGQGANVSCFNCPGLGSLCEKMCGTSKRPAKDVTPPAPASPAAPADPAPPQQKPNLKDDQFRLALQSGCWVRHAQFEECEGVERCKKPALLKLSLKSQYRAGQIQMKNWRLKQFKYDDDLPERVMVLLGLEEAGKTTFLNGLANYIMEVEPEDPFRFQCGDAGGTTEVALYTLPAFEGKQYAFNLTIVDTPPIRDPDSMLDILRVLQESIDADIIGGVDAINFIMREPASTSGSYKSDPSLGKLFQTLYSMLPAANMNVLASCKVTRGASSECLKDFLKENRTMIPRAFAYNLASLFADFSDLSREESTHCKEIFKSVLSSLIHCQKLCRIAPVQALSAQLVVASKALPTEAVKTEAVTTEAVTTEELGQAAGLYSKWEEELNQSFLDIGEWCQQQHDKRWKSRHPFPSKIFSLLPEVPFDPVTRNEYFLSNSHFRTYELDRPALEVALEVDNTARSKLDMALLKFRSRMQTLGIQNPSPPEWVYGFCTRNDTLRRLVKSGSGSSPLKMLCQ